METKDKSLANFGRLEICRAQKEMHGLMACRTRFGQEKPLRDVRISVSLLITVENTVLIETLIALGAKVRWCAFSCTSTEDHIAAALTGNTSLEIRRGKTLKEHWNDIYEAFDWGSDEGPDLILDTGDTLSLFQASFGSKDLPIDLVELVSNKLAQNHNKFPNIQKSLVGIAGITTGVKRLYGMEASGSLLCPALDVTKSQFDKCYECLHTLPVSLTKATSVMIAGTVSVVCGYGDVGKVCAAALKQAGSQVVVSESDPICALQALREGLQVVPLHEFVLKADIFINTIEEENIIMVDHMRKMKENAIVCNVSHCNSAIDINGLEACAGVSCIPTHSQIDKWFFLDTKSTIMVSAEGYLMNNLGYTCRHPLAMSCSLTNRVIALIELWNNKYHDKKVYPWTTELDKRVADLHIEKPGVKFTEPIDESQAELKEEEATQRMSELSGKQGVEQIMRDGETRENDLGTVNARITKLEEQSQVGTLKLQLLVAEKENENLKSMFASVLQQANDKVEKAHESREQAQVFSDSAVVCQGEADKSATAAHNSAEDAKKSAADAKAKLDELVGRAADLQQLDNVKTWVKALSAVILYLIISVLVCMSSATSFGTVKPNMFAMSFYFVVVSMTTTGFGDIVPDGVGMKMICCLMVLTGYCGLLGHFLGRVWDVAAIKIEERWWKDINESGKKKRRFWYAILRVLICLVTWVIAIGTLKLKEFDFWEAVYFSIMILTTTGYGDNTFKGKGKIFPSIWLLVTTFIFGKSFPVIFSEFSWSCLICVAPAEQPAQPVDQDQAQLQEQV